MGKDKTNAPRRRIRLGKILSTVLLVVAVLSGVVLWIQILNLVLKPPKVEQEKRVVRPVNVRVYEVTEEPMREIVRLPGTLTPYEEVKLSAELGGRIIDIALQEGSMLPQNPEAARELVLMTIDPSDLKKQLNDARAALALKRLEYDKAQELYNQSPPAVGKFELDTKKLQYEMAKSKVEIVENNLAKCYVHSPITGLLDEVAPEVGEYVVPGQHVATVVQTDRLKAVVGLPEIHAPFVKLGDRVMVRPTFAEDRELIGKITYMSMVADEKTKTYRAEITLDNPGGLLRPGMIVRVFLVRRVIEKARPIPLSAVIPAEGRQLVFVEKDGRAVEREVKLDQITGDRVNVLSGLEPGEHLIVEGQRQLRNDQEVEVVGRGELIEKATPPIDDISAGRFPELPGQPSWKTN